MWLVLFLLQKSDFRLPFFYLRNYFTCYIILSTLYRRYYFMAVILKSDIREVKISSTDKVLYHEFKRWLFKHNHYVKGHDKNHYLFQNDLWISGAIQKATRLGLLIEVQ